MFTPPPSPLPRTSFFPDSQSPMEQSPFLPPTSPSSTTTSKLKLDVSEQPRSALLTDPDLLTPQRSVEKKKSLGRRFRFFVVSVPIVLILMTIWTPHLLSYCRSHSSIQRSRDSASPAQQHPNHTRRPGLVGSLGLEWLIPQSMGRHSQRRRHHMVGILPRQSTIPLDSASSTASAPSPSTTIIPTAPQGTAVTVPNPFPQPFDVSLSSNFTTAACQTFFANFTQDHSFRACRSFGLLLANSHAFMQQETNLTVLNQIIWGTCNPNNPLETNIGVMNNLVGELKSFCAADLKAGNALAIAALVGFTNYELYYHVGCLTNPATQAYCYIEALASASPNDLYFYTLPLGIPLLNSTAPTCSTCNKAIMNVFSQFAINATLPISKTYPAAQEKTDAVCGANFAEQVQVLASAALPQKGPWAGIDLPLILGVIAAVALGSL